MNLRLKKKLRAQKLAKPTGTGSYEAVHTHFGRWILLDPEGNQINEDYLTKDEAAVMAEHLNDGGQENG